MGILPFLLACSVFLKAVIWLGIGSCLSFDEYDDRIGDEIKRLKRVLPWIS